MERLSCDILGLIVERVRDGRDRKSCSEVSKVWHTTEALTRVRVRVEYPDHIPNVLYRFTNLTTLEVGTLISDKALVLVSKTIPKLQTLNLSAHELYPDGYDPSLVDFGNEGLTAVAERCCDLRELSLRRRRNVRDGGIVAFRRNDRSLTTLDLSGCAWVTDVSLEAAAGMGSLLRLNLTYSFEVTDRGLDFLSSGPASRSLRALDFSYCARITDVGICGLKRISFLEDLDLHLCGPGELTDAAGVAVASISSLRKLNLSSHLYMTDSTLIAVAAGMSLLSELYIKNCPLITDHGLDLLSCGPAARCLKVLDISSCKLITDVGICSLERLPCLEELMLDGCGGEELTDVAGFAVASIPSLRKLHLSMQNRITDATLFAVADNCRNLVEIDLYDCKGEMEQGLLYLTSHLPLETLRVPQLGYPNQASFLYLMKIVEQCPSLKLLKLDYGIKRRFSPSQLETLSSMCKLDWV